MAQQWDRKSSSKSTGLLEVRGEQKVQEGAYRWPTPEMLKACENDHAW